MGKISISCSTRQLSRSLQKFADEAEPLPMRKAWQAVRSGFCAAARGPHPPHRPAGAFSRKLRRWGGHQSERTRLLATLEATRRNKSQAARRLKWSRLTLYRKMAKHAMRLADHGRSLKARRGQVIRVRLTSETTRWLRGRFRAARYAGHRTRGISRCRQIVSTAAPVADCMRRWEESGRASRAR